MHNSLSFLKNAGSENQTMHGLREGSMYHRKDITIVRSTRRVSASFPVHPRLPTSEVKVDSPITHLTTCSLSTTVFFFFFFETHLMNNGNFLYQFPFFILKAEFIKNNIINQWFSTAFARGSQVCYGKFHSNQVHQNFTN